MPYGTTFFLRLRLRMRQRPRSDPKQRPSDHQWHEKQIPQPCRPQANPPPCDPAIIPLLAHRRPPVHSPFQLVRITVYSSRFMLRMIATVVVAERRAGAACKDLQKESHVVAPSSAR